MKRKMIKTILCSVLIAALLAMPASGLAASKVAYILKVHASDAPGVYLRSSSDPKNLNTTKSTVVALLKNGTKVLYWGSAKGQMLKVLTANGKAGYIHRDSLKSYGAMNRKQLYVTKSATNVYKRAGSSMKKAGRVSKGLPVVVYRMSGNWAFVKNMAGKSGYIKKSALKQVA